MNGIEYSESIRIDKAAPEAVIEKTKDLAILHKKAVLANCIVIYILFWMATEQLYSFYEAGIFWQDVFVLIGACLLILTTSGLINAYIRGEMAFIVRIIENSIKKVEKK